jgi:hypothetical protein
MVTVEELHALKVSPHRLEVTVALMAMAAGMPAAKALEDIYELGQQSVVEDPQRFGLIGGRG